MADPKNPQLAREKMIGQVVFGRNVLAGWTIFRMYMILPGPSEAGSAIESFTMSCEGLHVGRVAPRAIGQNSHTRKTHTGLQGSAVTVQGRSAVNGRCRQSPRPQALTAVTLYWTDWPELIISVYSLVPKGNRRIRRARETSPPAVGAFVDVIAEEWSSRGRPGVDPGEVDGRGTRASQFEAVTSGRRRNAHHVRRGE